jgi:ABC-type phosphate transport system permease subunit
MEDQAYVPLDESKNREDKVVHVGSLVLLSIGIVYSLLFIHSFFTESVEIFYIFLSLGHFIAGRLGYKCKSDKSFDVSFASCLMLSLMFTFLFLLGFIFTAFSTAYELVVECEGIQCGSDEEKLVPEFIKQSLLSMYLMGFSVYFLVVFLAHSRNMKE